MFIKNNRKNSLIILLLLKLLILLSIVSITTIWRIYWLPYYNFYFTKYDYSYPQANKDFIIGTEPNFSPPQYLLNIIAAAFPDNKIIINNDVQPHLIIRSEHFASKDVFLTKYNKWAAPYISLSSERWVIKRNRYRTNAPPLLNFVARTATNDRQLYVPFMVWSGLEPKRIYSGLKRDKFAVYIASNCMPQRELLFKLLQQANIPGTEALGKCSNTGQKLGGSWGELDKVYAQYKFGFAMENHQVPGYITEKIINVFRGGAIPLYWGDSATVEKYFNPNAYIDVGKFANLQQAATFIIELSKDQERLQQMLQEPMFKDNIVPELFKINYDPDIPLVQEMALVLREKYFEFLAKT